MKYLLVMRGLPGAGKSTYAERVLDLFRKMYDTTVCSCSADKYFVGDDGVYRFDHTKLGQAHGQCKSQARSAMEVGINLIVIDNTNTTEREMEPYVSMAEKHGYKVKYKVVGKLDEDSVNEYFSRNIHGVPLDAIKRMAGRFQ